MSMIDSISPLLYMLRSYTRMFKYVNIHVVNYISNSTITVQ